MVIRAQENLIGARVFLFAVILAIVIGILPVLFSGAVINPWVIGILAILGIAVGTFVAEREVNTFLLASVSLVIVSFAGMQGIVLGVAVLGGEIGKAVSSILGALLVLFVPATIVVAVKTVFSLARS